MLLTAHKTNRFVGSLSNAATNFKVVALITIEVHARGVTERLHHVSAHGTSDFEWSKQLRFYWSREVNDCVVKQARMQLLHNFECSKTLAANPNLNVHGLQVSSSFTYGYEYQGNNGRLVITPLTDHCYMTLGAAICSGRGGNPLGPAGTGKALGLPEGIAVMHNVNDATWRCCLCAFLSTSRSDL